MIKKYKRLVNVPLCGIRMHFGIAIFTINNSNVKQKNKYAVGHSQMLSFASSSNVCTKIIDAVNYVVV